MPSINETPGAKELLAADHAALDDLLKTLLVALDEDDAATIFQRLDLFWARLAMHIRAENLHLFPAILTQSKEPGPQTKSLGAAETRRAIAQLRADHDFFMHELADAVKLVRNLRDLGASAAERRRMDVVRSSIQAVSKRLESHNAIEEQFIYGLPVELLPANEQLAVIKGIQRELQNLPPRFADASTADSK